jgi:transposase
MRAPHLAARRLFRDDDHLAGGVAELVGDTSANARLQHSAEDIGDEYRRIELITGRRRRRDWTLEEKAEILAASMEPGRSVTEVADQYGVSRSLLWTWRRNAREALACQAAQNFIPVRLAADPLGAPAAGAGCDPEPVSSTQAEASDAVSPPGSIEITVGRTRVRVQGAVDQNALRQVLALVATAR